MFSCEFGEIFKNTFFAEQLWTSASADPYDHFISTGETFLKEFYLKLVRSRNASKTKNQLLPTEIVFSPDEVSDRCMLKVHVKLTKFQKSFHLTLMDFAESLSSQCTHQEIKILKIL